MVRAGALDDCFGAEEVAMIQGPFSLVGARLCGCYKSEKAIYSGNFGEDKFLTC